MKFEDRYPVDEESYWFQRVEGEVCRSVYVGKCAFCGADTDFITYAFPRPAIPVCSQECHEQLEELAKND